MTAQSEAVNAIALQRACCYGVPGAAGLLMRMGSATELMAARHDVRAVMPDAPDRLVSALAAAGGQLPRAEEEAGFAGRAGISVISICDSRYPQRLRHTADPPLALFYKGSADLNRQRVVAVVGTRRCTPYGRDIIHHLARRLRQLSPGTLVVSGLAYGVDICAHNEALDNGLDTVAVLAHGLDYIYPARHRPTAVRMLAQGGLLTEYCSQSNADKLNFVRRNRIVAGMCDATILIESASHGGGLITTGLAADAGRAVFAYPGPVGAEYSEGCNNLIRDGGARLMTSADDLVAMMGWQDDSRLADARRKGIERDLFPQLTAGEQKVVDALRQHGDTHVNALQAMTGLTAGDVAALLFTLEMKGLVRTLAGSTAHLIT